LRDGNQRIVDGGDPRAATRRRWDASAGDEKYSVMLRLLAVQGTPFFLRYPSRKFVVTDAQIRRRWLIDSVDAVVARRAIRRRRRPARRDRADPPPVTRGS
jgi:hypothetical protein